MGVATRQAAAAREAILEAAPELIRIHGVAGMAISDLISRSGTSAGAIYHHFGSKQGLILEVAREAVSRPITMVMQTPKSGELAPWEVFGLALTRVVQDTPTAELLVQIWAGAAADPELAATLRTETSGVRAAVAAIIADWCVREGVEQDPMAVAEVLIGLVLGYAVQRALLPNFDQTRYLATGTRLLAGLVGGRP